MILEISAKELQKILVECKTGAYAGGGTKPYAPTHRGTLLYTKSIRSWTFYDEYAGDAYFSGHEYLTYKQQQKEFGIWSMVYRGTVLDIELKHHYIFDFLREALKAMPVDLPFRGPLGRFTNETLPDLEYTNELLRPSGLTDGNGIEKIFYKGEEIYFGIWSGGLVLENFGDIKLV